MTEPLPQPCQHDWTTYVERLKSERPTPEEQRKTANLAAVPISAYFKTKECGKCQAKVRLNYRVGPIKVPEGMDVREFQP